MQSLIGRKEPMAAAPFEHKDTLRGVRCVWFGSMQKPRPGKGALMMDTEGVYQTTFLQAQCNALPSPW